MEGQSCVKIHVRVKKDKTNKRKFERCTIEEFPVLSEVKDMKKCLCDVYGELLVGVDGCIGPSKIEIGYVGYSNKKFPIDTNDDLRRAFASGSVHAGKCPVFFMVPSDEDLTQSGNVNATIYSMYIYLDMNKS